MSRKIALVTGGTKGIGLAVAEKLLSDQYDVVLTYLSDTPNAVSVKRDLSAKYKSNVDLLKIDISDLSSIDIIYSFLVEKDLRIDALVLNAGVTNRAGFLEMEINQWKKVFDANVHFPVFLVQKIATRLNQNSAIIFTGSLMGIHPHAVSLAYGVSKSAVHALVENLVKFLKPLKIRVNAVAPGFVDTEWHKSKTSEIKESINGKIALGRFADPSEIAEVYMFLIRNQYVNGEVVVVDGGYSFK